MLALDPRPEPGQESAEEEALRREEGPRQPRLEEADGRPGRGDGARHEGAHAQRVHDELVERREGEVVQRLVLGDQEGGVDEQEEARQGREGAQPEGQECAAAGWVLWVQGRAA